MKKLIPLALLLSATLWIGCKKSEPAAPPAAAPADGGAAPATPPANP